MRIGYVSFRLAGWDGVTLEAARWKEILERRGHEVVNIAGELGGTSGEQIPELHFLRQGEVPVGVVEEKLREVISRQKIEKLIVANMWSLPLNKNAATAMRNVVSELGLSTVSRNHDFWWEREYSGECPGFPPTGKNIMQVTINSLAAVELKKRTGEDSVVIGDCVDYANEPDLRIYDQGWRKELEIDDDEVVFVQATRIIPRKRIELAVELVEKLADPRVVLVIVGEGGDEGNEYEEKLRECVAASPARAVFARDTLTNKYGLWDYLAHGDWMTYPSAWEGFGNQLLEGIYFKKPIFLNRYEVYKRDIEPLGFDVVAIDGEVTEAAVGRVREWMADPDRVGKATEKNYWVAQDNFSFEVTERKLEELGF